MLPLTMHEDKIRNMFNNCNVARFLGVDVYELKEGHAKGKLTIKKEHVNVFGTAHGGILFTLGDHVGGACGNTVGRKSLLIESSIQYVKGISEGDTVIAEADLTYAGKKIGRIDVKLYRENMEIVALMHMVFYITSYDHRGTTP